MSPVDDARCGGAAATSETGDADGSCGEVDTARIQLAPTCPSTPALRTLLLLVLLLLLLLSSSLLNRVAPMQPLLSPKPPYITYGFAAGAGCR